MATSNKKNDKKTTAAADQKVQLHSERSRFESKSGATLDVVLRETTKGWKTLALLKKAAKSGDDKPKAEKGLVTVHKTREEAEKGYAQMLKDAQHEGWVPRQRVVRTR